MVDQGQDVQQACELRDDRNNGSIVRVLYRWCILVNFMLPYKPYVRVNGNRGLSTGGNLSESC